MRNDCTVDELLAADELHQSLQYFVSDGLRNTGGEPSHTIGRLIGWLSQQHLQEVRMAMAMQGAVDLKPSKKKPPTLAQNREKAYGKFAEYQKANSISEIARTPVPLLRHFPEKAQEAIAVAAGITATSPFVASHKDPVMFAWLQARGNVKRARQRIGAVMFLASQVGRDYGLDKELLQAEIDEAIQLLWSKVVWFMESEMKFAIILGGEALAATRADVITNSFGEGMGIMQYLERDERFPGSWLTKTETAFRNKIAKYAKE